MIADTRWPRWGSDLVVDLLREAGIAHVAGNPGASVRGLHDSLVHAPAGAPGFVLCLHEGVAVGVAQGYAKACGRPMAVLLHDLVGLQNASMAIYNAWCDRVPMLLLGGTGPMSKARRRPWIDWIHTAAAQAEAVRHYVKWDDQPSDLASVPESFARAVTTTAAAPAGPVYWCLDVDVQEQELQQAGGRVPMGAWSTPTAPAPGGEDADVLAELLRGARRPVLAAGYAGDTEEGFALLVELAELLQAPVLDLGPRLNFPTDHPLWALGDEELLADADLLVLLEVDDPLAATAAVPGSPVVTVGCGHLRLRSWAHDYQSLVPSARSVTAAPVPALRALLDRLRDEPPDPECVRERHRRTTGRTAARRAAWAARARAATTEGSVPLERLLAELGALLDDDGGTWTLSSGTNDRLEHRLWPLRRPRQWCGHSGGGGLGYAPAGAVGVALARPGELVVDVQADGDLLYAPQALWTAARLRVPVLYVVHNNRAYGNTVGHARAVAASRGRPPGREYDGSGLDDPAVDLAGLARALGVAAWGPVTTVEALRPALATALATARSGRPALVEVITPGGPDVTLQEDS